MNIRTGQGIDFHRLEKGLDLWLGGIRVPSERGCVAHSDGDVLIHAICDAMLGAAGLRDIGYYFPDSNPEYRNIDSKVLLGRTAEIIKKKGFQIVNIDSTVCLEEPKLSPYIPEMISILAGVLNTDSDNVSVKATTTEKMGFTGRGEGVIAIASVLISSM
jgi:2-C-methyl-D-erythritol 2,4-cyclodiphosphate synthase